MLVRIQLSPPHLARWRKCWASLKTALEYKEKKVNKMFEYPMEKYRFYCGPNKIVAVSTYEGRTVRGVAKCDPRDSFDAEKGKELAAARCNQKVATKRQRRAERELKKAIAAHDRATKYLGKMNDYYEDARKAVYNADTRVDKILANM